MKWTVARFTIGLVTLILGLLIWSVYVHPRHRVIDQREFANTEFKVRITVCPDDAFPTPRILYVFQSAPVSSDNWREIATIPTDQLVPERGDWVRFVSNRVGYAFLSSYYMVTTDGGDTWVVWEANKDLPVEQLMERYNLWPAIKEIDMQSDGTGRMTLYQYLNEREKGPDLYTTDFGYHWTIDYGN